MQRERDMMPVARPTYFFQDKLCALISETGSSLSLVCMWVYVREVWLGLGPQTQGFFYQGTRDESRNVERRWYEILEWFTQYEK